MELRIAEIEARLQPLLDAEERAKALSSQVPRSRVFVGMCGAQLDFASFDILSGFGSIRGVTNPPGIVHVFQAADLHEPSQMAVGRYSPYIQAELAFGSIDISEHNDEEFLLAVAWHSAALIKLRGHSTLFCPVSASVSWDTISAYDDHSVKFRVLDDIPRQISLTKQRTKITVEDLEWVKKNWDVALDLRNKDKSRRFGLAFNIAYLWNQTGDLRIAIANLWCGLEALFGDQNDKHVTAKLAERISNWVPSVTPSEIRQLYKQRCDAVHGRWLKDTEIGLAISASENVLRQALIKCIEANSVTLPDWK